jgi:hypothetical protein
VFPKQENLILPLLDVLVKCPGGVRTHLVYGKLAKYYPDLSEADQNTRRPKSSDTYWRNNVRFARAKAVERGFMPKYPWGIWKVFPPGSAYWERHMPTWKPEYSASTPVQRKEEAMTDRVADQKLLFQESDLEDHGEAFAPVLLSQLLSEEEDPHCPFCNVLITADNSEIEEEETEDNFLHMYRGVTCLECKGSYSLHMAPVDLMVHHVPVVKPTVEKSLNTQPFLIAKMAEDPAVNQKLFHNYGDKLPVPHRMLRMGALGGCIRVLMENGSLYPDALFQALEFLNGKIVGEDTPGYYPNKISDPIARAISAVEDA